MMLPLVVSTTEPVAAPPVRALEVTLIKVVMSPEARGNVTVYTFPATATSTVVILSSASSAVFMAAAVTP
jgi:hypothetical protein